MKERGFRRRIGTLPKQEGSDMSVAKFNTMVVIKQKDNVFKEERMVEVFRALELLSKLRLFIECIEKDRRRIETGRLGNIDSDSVENVSTNNQKENLSDSKKNLTSLHKLNINFNIIGQKFYAGQQLSKILLSKDNSNNLEVLKDEEIEEEHMRLAKSEIRKRKNFIR